MQFRTIAASAFTLSILAYLNVIPFYYVLFIKETFIQFPPQIWRLVTAFLITGPKFGIIFDTYFCMCHTRPQTVTTADSGIVYTYGSKLEKASPKFTQPGDFLTYILFVCTVIVVSIIILFLYYLIPLAPHITARIVHCPQLLRFLKMRKITPAASTGPSFAK